MVVSIQWKLGYFRGKDLKGLNYCCYMEEMDCNVIFSSGFSALFLYVSFTDVHYYIHLMYMKLPLVSLFMVAGSVRSCNFSNLHMSYGLIQKCWLNTIRSSKSKVHPMDLHYTGYTPVHRGAFYQFPFRWIYYYGSNKSTGKETGKTHLCALCKWVMRTF